MECRGRRDLWDTDACLLQAAYDLPSPRRCQEQRVAGRERLTEKGKNCAWEGQGAGEEVGVELHPLLASPRLDRPLRIPCLVAWMPEGGCILLYWHRPARLRLEG